MRKTIHPKYLPCRMPIYASGVVWLLLDRLQPGGFWWGVGGALITVQWLYWLGGMANEDWQPPSNRNWD